MKNYFSIGILLSLSIHLMANDIALPEINNDMRSVAKEAISNARIEAVNIKKPTINDTLKHKIYGLTKQVQQQSEAHNVSVKNLLDKTVNNKAWVFKQAQLIKGASKDLGVDDETQVETLSGHRLYLFISSSMPKNKVRQYARQLSKYPNTQMVMRGFIGGGRKMQPTMKYIKSIIVKNENCNGVDCKTYTTKINIDPVLFQRYGIDKVPTLVYVDKLSGANYCSEGNADIVHANGVHKFTGLAPIKYMISELADKTKLSKLGYLSKL